jgi:leucyl aminopeptidase
VIAVAKSEGGPVLLPGSESVDAALSGRLASALSDVGFGGDEGETTRFATLGALTAPVVAAVGVGALEDGATAPSAQALRKAAAVVTRGLAGRIRNYADAARTVAGTPATGGGEAAK